MLLVYGYYIFYNYFSSGIDIGRHNLTSITSKADPGIEKVKTKRQVTKKSDEKYVLFSLLMQNPPLSA